jgi:hypothetical protein
MAASETINYVTNFFMLKATNKMKVINVLSYFLQHYGDGNLQSYSKRNINRQLYCLIFIDIAC